MSGTDKHARIIRVEVALTPGGWRNNVNRYDARDTEKMYYVAIDTLGSVKQLNKNRIGVLTQSECSIYQVEYFSWELEVDENTAIDQLINRVKTAAKKLFDQVDKLRNQYEKNK